MSARRRFRLAKIVSAHSRSLTSLKILYGTSSRIKFNGSITFVLIYLRR